MHTTFFLSATNSIFRCKISRADSACHVSIKTALFLAWQIMKHTTSTSVLGDTCRFTSLQLPSGKHLCETAGCGRNFHAAVVFPNKADYTAHRDYCSDGGNAGLMTPLVLQIFCQQLGNFITG